MKTKNNGFFPVIRLHRDDMIEDELKVGLTEERAHRLTDSEMEAFARRIGDSLMCGGDFWTAVENVCKDIIEEDEIEADKINNDSK